MGARGARGAITSTYLLRDIDRRYDARGNSRYMSERG